MIRNLVLTGCFIAGLPALAATNKAHYYGHDAVVNEHGVISPWYQGLNGQCDYRVRIAAETLKRYPWTTTKDAIAAYPAYVFSGQWTIAADGAITPLPTSDWDTADIGQRSVCVLFGMMDYYRYTGDPAAIAHLTYMGDFLLDACQTPPEHPWPNFPISVPIKGKVFQKCDPNGMIQLDICANMGQGLLRAYQVTGNQRWFAAARHWGDLLAERCDLDPTADPWPRYANPEAAPWKNNKQTGGVVLILGFLDELIRLGHSGKDGAVLKAREAGIRYLADKLLPAWHVDDTWGRYFWDWENPTQCCTLAAEVPAYLVAQRQLFPNWRCDARNIMTLFYNRTSPAPESGGDVYSGAWAYPESSSCCGRSLWYSPLLVGSILGQYAAVSGDAWMREMAVRQLILQTYDIHETGVTEDNIDGGIVVNGAWLNIAHPLPLRWVLAAIGWLPEELGASRENHIVRSSAVVSQVRYGDGDIAYSTFDAPPETVDVLRLAFAPQQITANERALSERQDLSANGYTVKKLSNGDTIVHVRHDSATRVRVRGEDPQRVLDASALTFDGAWTTREETEASGKTLRATEAGGAAVAAKFEGNQVRLIGDVGPAGGLAEVFVDGVKQLVPVDCWNPTPRSRQVLYYRNGLSDGEHTLKFVATGTANPYSQGRHIYVDAVQFSAENAPGGPSAGTGPTEAQRMILGYPARQDYRDADGHLWRPGTEVVTRLAPLRDTVAECWWTDAVTEPITGTPDPELYRYGYHARDFWVNLTVGPGKYYVRLKFAATRGLDTRKNCFDILLNGRKVVERLDVAGTASGVNKAADLVFNGITPKNGIIEIRFTSPLVGDGGQTVRGEAFVQAIEIGPGPGGQGATPVSSTASAPAGNLLLNPGFEETKAGAPADKHGQYAGDEWRAELKGSAMVYLWQESAFAGRPAEGLPEFHSGQGALRTHAEKDCHAQIYQDVVVQPGTTYTGSVWVRAVDLRGKGFGNDPAESAALLLLELDDNNKVLKSHERVLVTKAGPYRLLSKTITTGRETTTVRFSLETILKCSYTEGHVTYDDCAVLRGPAATPAVGDGVVKDLLPAAQDMLRGYMVKSVKPMPEHPGMIRVNYFSKALPEPLFRDDQWDWGDCGARAVQAWIWLREMTGDRHFGEAVEQGEIKALLHVLAPDTGMPFVPERSKPQEGTYYYEMWDQGRTLRALVAMWQAETTEQAKTDLRGRIDKMISGLSQSATRGSDPKFGSFAIYPFEGGRNVPTNTCALPAAGQLVEPLAEYWAATGDVTTREFLDELLAGVFSGKEGKYARFEEDGSFYGHFHGHAATALGVAKFGKALCEKGEKKRGLELLRWAKKVYDWTVSPHNGHGGSSWGWFPENTGEDQQSVKEYAEICCVADMIEFAALLAECAEFDSQLHEWDSLWDHVERYTFNTILPLQFRITDEYKAALKHAITGNKIQNGYVQFELDANGCFNHETAGHQTLITDTKSAISQLTYGVAYDGKQAVWRYKAGIRVQPVGFDSDTSRTVTPAGIDGVVQTMDKALRIESQSVCGDGPYIVRRLRIVNAGQAQLRDVRLSCMVNVDTVDYDHDVGQVESDTGWAVVHDQAGSSWAGFAGDPKPGYITADDVQQLVAGDGFDWKQSKRSFHGNVALAAGWDLGALDAGESKTVTVTYAGASNRYDLHRALRHEKFPEKPVSSESIDAALAVAERLAGSWVALFMPNEWYCRQPDGPVEIYTAGCCAYSGPRALYACWKSAVADDGQTVKIRMPVCCRSEVLIQTVTEGPDLVRQEIRMHQTRLVSVRIPDWADIGKTQACNGRGDRLQLRTDGRWLQLGKIRQDTTVTITYPLSDRESTERVAGAGKSMGFSPATEQRSFTAIYRGNIVIGMKPRPETLPVFP
ncbi:MAG: hypothetical protein JXA69_01975 [Phycisphaerae bacterium]|nr:hypothetical protein [Phycisphaerae bacterium]